MIDFEEELKKFHPSPEVEEVEDIIHAHDASDLIDVLLSMMETEQGEHY
ncbi:MAG: hypothetical protein K5985_05140 [Lachnospiraceae bacterium]|nr:hypothetical protein [Lachnospiraceae bacterium]